MAKFKKIDETDFDFSKIPKKVPTYFWERFFATFFIVGFSSLLFLAPNVKPSHEPPIQYEPFYTAPEDLVPQYPDYIVTPEDKKMFADIFNYDSQSGFSKTQNIKSFQEMVRNNDLLNGSFEKKGKFDVTSNIIAIEPSDKNAIVKDNGRADLDYVDLVVQKTYTQNKDSYYEQQMVNLVLDKHKIVSMNTHRMID